MDLNGKYAVVTGASSGIGKALVGHLLKEGAFVLGISRSIEKTMDITHARLWVKNMDLSKKETIDMLFEYAKNCFGTIDVFIANAGYARYGAHDDIDYETMENLLELNTTGIMYTAKKMQEVYGDKPYNFMVTLSAIAELPMPGYALYGASKAALDNYFSAVRLEEKKTGHVYQRVYPVATRTDFFNRADAKYMPWPVQNPEHVAKKIVKGIRKDKKKIYPSFLYKWGKRITPWFFKIYLRNQRKKFEAHETNK
ncbi:MAG: SDR family NAD(P)-dependent oxidoreductase [Bacillota bacterium]